MSELTADIGLIGLGVMGQMLALNMERNGYRVAGYDLGLKKVHDFTRRFPSKNIIGCETLEMLLATLEKPRLIMMMIPAGEAVDAVVRDLQSVLEAGDLLIDGGNTHFVDTERRAKDLESLGILYIGTGISGGEYGALWGPSIMPGGSPEAWSLVQPIFEAIAAKVDGEPCVTYIGPGGSGHYVKMVHNGIEYGDMQLIAEAYDLLARGLGLSPPELHDVFADWNKGDLQSYLIEITSSIFAKIDEETNRPLADLILDEAKQKGTGKWTSQNALDLGVPTPTINAAVEARILSAYKNEREKASTQLRGPEQERKVDRQEGIEAIKDGLYAAKICTYAQGFALLRLASKEYGFNLSLSEIARIWRGGCIIRARLLENIRQAFLRNPDATNILLDQDLGRAVEVRQGPLRKVINIAIESGIPVPAFSSALAYFDGYRSARLPANLTQAQRDYFGAHTYRRIDKEGSFHTEWLEITQRPE
ncbi:MAG: NADP-dependent phosphogluconate dehydrogenase [Anaerolineales bacterium]|nr:MAG: NADP-dependent phosphogluconate dehydrogenase [Anaerolineales bacterium]